MFRKFSIAIFLFAFLATGCSQPSPGGAFTVKGKLLEAGEQSVYLEQLFFSDRNPEIIDSSVIRKGEFVLKGRAAEEGMFRIRVNGQPGGFIFINDAASIPFSASLKDLSLEGPEFKTKANLQLKNFILRLQDQQASLMKLDSTRSVYLEAGGQDSLVRQLTEQLNRGNQAYYQGLLQFADTVSSPVVALFALGYTQRAEPTALAKTVQNLEKRFASHQGVASVAKQYRDFVASQQAAVRQDSLKKSRPAIGDMAPDFTLPDAQGNPVALSSLRGKYVLVDFWASWCGPCRQENPNLVKAYAAFASRNFTVLGVSLDENKEKWIKAIQDDKLSWTQVSDLKGWEASVVPLYGFDGIPYNVLLDPQGKIIETELRGDALMQALEKHIRK